MYPLGGYGYNGLGSDRSLNTSFATGVRGSDVKVPADMIALGDANLLFVMFDQTLYNVPLSRNPCVTGFGVLAKDWNPPPGSPDPQYEWRAAVGQRHRDRYSIGFCDGHIETLLHERLYDASDAARRRWNRDNEP